jgi:xylulokinase
MDIGTTCVKGLLLDGDGEVLATVAREVPVLRPRPEWAEIHPDEWWHAVTEVAAELIGRGPVSPAAIEAMSIVSMRDAVVLTDAGGEVLRPSILWTDMRTLPQVQALAEEVGAERLMDISGTIPVVGLVAPALLWHQQHEPELWARVDRIRLVKDWIVWRLTGVDETDESSITRSLLNDARRRSWSPELLKAAGVSPRQLTPVIRRPIDQIGTLSPSGAIALGLPAGLPVVAGGGDDPAAALGAGAVTIDSICIGTGTGSDWRRVMAQYTPDLTGRCDCSTHLVPNRHLLAATIDGTGTSLRWLRDILGHKPASDSEDNGFDTLTALAGEIELGADELRFFPYISGQRAPHYLPHSTGVFFGLRAGHTPGHLARAVLEGVAFQYPATLEILGVGPGVQPQITMIDGETRSPLWNQIKADVLGLPISVPAVREAAALGAALLAGVGVGAFADAESAVAQAVHPGVTVVPDPARHAVYRDLLLTYLQVHECLEPAFDICKPSPIVQPTPQRSLHSV